MFEWVTMWYLRNAERYLAANGIPKAKEGDEPSTKGLLCISDGKTYEQMLDDKLLLSRYTEQEFRPLKNETEFIRYLDEMAERKQLDGAFFYDSRKGIKKVNTIFPNSFRVENLDDIREMVPADFISPDGSIPPSDENVGTKSKNACWLPQIYNEVYTVAVRQTVHGNAGFGTVLGFDKNGLRERVRMDIDPANWGPFIDEKNKVVGVYEKFEKTEDGVKCIEKKMVYVRDGMLVYRDENPGGGSQADDVIGCCCNKGLSTARLLSLAH